VTRELLPHLSYLFGSQRDQQIQLDTILFFQKAPYFITPSWTNSFLDHLSNSLSHPPRFGNLSSCPVIDYAFHQKSSCQPFLPFYQPQHECRPNSNWSFCANTITFSNHAWYFDLQSSLEIQKAIVGKKKAISHSPNLICLNQRIGTRSILNLKEVHQLLVNIFPNDTIKIYSYEGKDFLHQISLIHQCKLILHPHSGGETNLIFLQSNSIVIEFFPKNFPPISYFGDLVKSAGSIHIPVILKEVQLPSSGCKEYKFNETSCVKPPFSYRVPITKCNFCYKDSMLRVDINELRGILQNLPSPSYPR
jgi:hypothetical protein